ncbi:glycosyltransferase [Cytophagaceae bacterium 50C-KIRBA]|uniref:Glycosyltransferase n=1 Tax=Aquirufa beregesia TaxID=2516556 RepID=A0ABX0EVT4_9BACT|nr:glycosyltransferase family 2 protein [Aquirufa beregesia]NGZ43970.1 glycosyltransferase [Aquirufa beregesia]
MNSPKVSIITVCYQSAATLRQTIESVLAQDYPNLEYWVIDGGSKDDSLSILKDYEGRIYYISEKDQGIYDAMNKGLARVSGDIIGMIGSDDFYPANDIISSVVTRFQEKGTDTVYGDIQFVDPISGALVRFWSAGEYQRNNWLWGWMPPHLSFYAKKSVYDEIGPFRTDFTCAGDYDWMLRALYKAKKTAAYLPKTLMTMRNGGTSTASWKHRLVANREDRQAWKDNGLQPYFFTLFLKPVRKIFQLFNSEKKAGREL